MAINYKVFRQELYIEHLEEAAYLYETRVAWLTDDEIGWQDLEHIDDTMEAHLDALMVGESLALAVCIDSLADADASMLHAIVRIFCRHRLIENLAKLWVDFDFDDNEKVKAVADAFKWECPPEWFPHLLAVFSGSHKKMFPVLAPSVAYSNMQPDATFLQALDCAEPEHLSRMIQAVSFFPQDPQSCATKLAPYVSHADTQVAAQASYALLRLGYPQVIERCRGQAAKLPYVIAVGGKKGDAQLLLQIARDGIADGDCLLAMGISGEPQVMPFLINYLKHPDCAPMAALGLQVITGANLYEDVHIPDEITEDELFEDELEDFRRGKLPENIDGKPMGNECHKLSTDQKAWSDWIEQSKHPFSPGIRYRNGKPFSHLQLLANLLDNQMPTDIRQLAYQELVIRYTLDIPFEPDDIVVRQKKQLNSIHKWAIDSKPLFREGVWYFRGQQI